MKQTSTAGSPYSQELQRWLSGRSLLPAELPFDPSLIENHEAAGFITSKPGITSISGRKRCTRCGNVDPRLFAVMPCRVCRKECGYCRSCIMMGRVSECTSLYTWTGPELSWNVSEPVMAWEGSLSPAQAAASAQAAEAAGNGGQLLVWAVCGAGKTEVLFQAVESVLKQGRRICLAVPRTDVVLELAPRLKQAFPHTPLAALYGGSEQRHDTAQLVISTTHQLFRYESAFDAMIIDEVDAFPYSADPSLHFAVEKARKPDSAVIYLTATPSKDMQHAAASGRLPFIKIPARFHRRPVPIPEHQWCGNWQKLLNKKKLHPSIIRWASERLENRVPVLLFFPSIADMQKALPLFQQLHPGLLSVHAADPDRKEKVAVLRKGEIPGLLTTTILERGVTIPRLEAAVIGAEQDIFTESALVQIAGRVGRSKDHAFGSIRFFHYGKSRAMLDAVSHIKRMNQEAEARGLLDV